MDTDIRSKQCVFVSHCILAQMVRANGLAKYNPGVIKQVVQWCLDNDINMIQMPCPETLCMSGGLGRDPHGKKWYEEHAARIEWGKIAQDQAEYAKQLVDGGCEILAIIGVEFSPACAVTKLNRGPVIIKDQGIYIEELKFYLLEYGLDIPFLGIHPPHHKVMARDLAALL